MKTNKRGYFLRTNERFIDAIEQGGFKPAQIWWNGELLKFDTVWINSHGDIINMQKSCGIHKYECTARYRPAENIKSTNNAGYMITSVCGKTYLLHRIVASTFLEKPADKNEINHKDKNKLNCDVSNLEWCTRQENMNHHYGKNSN